MNPKTESGCNSPSNFLNCNEYLSMSPIQPPREHAPFSSVATEASMKFYLSPVPRCRLNFSGFSATPNDYPRKFDEINEDQSYENMKALEISPIRPNPYTCSPFAEKLKPVEQPKIFIEEVSPSEKINRKEEIKLLESPNASGICCNCKKSQCLKLYCDCFSRGQFCKGCNCVDCHNTIANEQERNYNIAAISSKNPAAFKKISKVENEEKMGKVTCNCTKSNCMKKYCECFKFGSKCSASCNCTGCNNTQTLQTIACKRKQKQIKKRVERSALGRRTLV